MYIATPSALASSGCNVAVAIKIAESHPEIETIVTMINDSGQRYFSTELCGEKKELKYPRGNIRWTSTQCRNWTSIKRNGK
jgi:hypothetical protein